MKKIAFVAIATLILAGPLAFNGSGFTTADELPACCQKKDACCPGSCCPKGEHMPGAHCPMHMHM